MGRHRRLGKILTKLENCPLLCHANPSLVVTSKLRFVGVVFLQGLCFPSLSPAWFIYVVRVVFASLMDGATSSSEIWHKKLRVEVRASDGQTALPAWHPGSFVRVLYFWHGPSLNTTAKIALMANTRKCFQSITLPNPWHNHFAHFPWNALLLILTGRFIFPLKCSWWL